MIINNQGRRSRRYYIRCKKCNKQISRNRMKLCRKCQDERINREREGYNNNDGEGEIQVLQEQLGGTIRYNTEINKRNKDIINQGYIDTKKHEDCVRMLALNSRGFGPDNKEKVNMLKKAMVNYEIDVVLFSGTDRSWTEYRRE